MESAFTRVAVVQLDYYPALFADFCSPLEDPGGATPLLPANADIPPEERRHFAKLRARVREAYCEQLLVRLQTILAACRTWEVKVVVLPEYSVPWDILKPVAHAAGPMVVVAGTHRVERDGLQCGLYERLGCAKEALPKAGQAVAPVLYQGSILALVPKLHPASAVQEEIEPGNAWQPVTMPEGFPGPMGVLICLDFLHRESPRYQEHVAKQLAECRFLAVPSWTSPRSTDEFAAKAWEEARRYGRPVLYADHASGGGTAFFVDEERHSELLPYPKRPGCLRPNEEGVLVADIDMGYARPGGSTRYAQPRPVKPQAAATLVYTARPIENEYATWVLGLFTILDPESGSGLDEAFAHIEEHRALLGRVRDAASPTRRERLQHLLEDTKYIANLEMIAQLVVELPLPPTVLPMEALRAAHVTGAKEAVVWWLAKTPALATGVARLLEEASRVRLPALVDEAFKEAHQAQGMVRGRVVGVPLQNYFGHNMSASNGTSLSFWRAAQDLEMRMSPRQVSSVLHIPIEAELPRSEHTPTDNGVNRVHLQLVAHHAHAAVAFSHLLAAEGTRTEAAIVVSRIFWMRTDGMITRRGRSVTFPDKKAFLLVRRNEKWCLATYEPVFQVQRLRTGASGGDVAAFEDDLDAAEQQRPPRLDAASREPIREAFEECGIEIEDFEVVDDDAFERRCEAVLARFEGAGETVRALRELRLAEVSGHFVEPSLAYERSSYTDFLRHVESVVEPALSALRAWLGGRLRWYERAQQAAILLGEYGAGKSTLLAAWASELWEAPEGPRPLLVDLAASSAKSPRALLLEAARLEDTPENRAALRLVIHTGKVFPVFDGFDEMATRVTTSELPQRLADLFDTAERVGRIVLSSRDHYFPTEGEMKTALERALTASIGGPAMGLRFDLRFFSEEQVRSLLRAVMVDAASAEALWERIQSTYDLKELCRRPILLAMIIATREELLRGEIVRRGELYEACLRRWLRQACGPEPEIFSTDQKRLLAQTIAVETWRSGEPGVALETLRHLLQESFPPSFFDDVPRTAEVLEVTGGMFLVREPAEAGERYRFAHKSLQEYFLASAIVRAAEGSVRGVPRVLSVKPLTLEVIDFIDEILEGERGRVGSAFVGNVGRWLATRCASGGQVPIMTADAAANATRLLLQLARRRGHEAGWIPERVDLREVSLTGEDIRGARLVGARLEGANLCAADLSHANLEGACLRGALLRGTRLDETNLRKVRAEGADFTFAEAHGAMLEGAQMQGAVLHQSMWVRCCWEGASLKDADALAWMAPGARGLGSDAGATPTPLSIQHVELAADVDERDLYEDFLAGNVRPDGIRVAAVTFRGDLFLWDLLARRCLGSLPEALVSRDASSIRWSMDADIVVTLEPGGTARAFHLRDLEVIRSMGVRFTRIAVNAEGTLVAASDEEGSVRVISLASGEAVAALEASGAAVLAMEFSGDGRALAITDSSGRGVLWAFAEGTRWTFYAGLQPLHALALHPGTDMLAGSAGDAFIRFWKLSERRALQSILTTEVDLGSLHFSPSGARLAGVSAKGVVRVWDVEERREVSRFDLDTRRRVRAVAWTRDESRLALLGSSVEIWDHERGARVSTSERSPYAIFEIIRWADDANRLVCSGRSLDRALMVDCDAGCIQLLPEEERTGGPDGEPHGDGDPAARGPTAARMQGQDALRAAARALGVQEDSFVDASSALISPGGERIAVGHDDGTISIIDEGTRKTRTAARAHRGSVRLLEWSHDGSRLASADGRGMLCIWDASGPSLLVTITGSRGSVLARTPGGYCALVGEAASHLRLALATKSGSRARRYAPLGSLREALHKPERVAAALRGDLSRDDAEHELAQLGYLDGPDAD